MINKPETLDQENKVIEEQTNTEQKETIVQKENNIIDEKVANIEAKPVSQDIEKPRFEQSTYDSNFKKPYKPYDSKDENENGVMLVSKSKLLECGVQYGHQVQWWNPKMKQFINFTKNGIHIINLHKTIVGLQNAFTSIQKLTESGRKVLFVGTTKQAKESIKLNAERVETFYIDNRWLGGLLTNFKTIKNSIVRLKTLEKLEKENFEGYTKKEGLKLKKELDKLNENLGGIKFMRKLPDAIFVSSLKTDKIAIQEAKKLGIPVFGIVDTNVDPNLVEFPIPANDDAIKSSSLIITIMADGIAQGMGKPMIAAHKQNSEVKILGIDENFVKEYKPNKYNNSRPPYNKGTYSKGNFNKYPSNRPSNYNNNYNNTNNSNSENNNNTVNTTTEVVTSN